MSPANGFKASHNPKVAGSNPAPATSRGPSKEGPRCSKMPRRRQMSRLWALAARGLGLRPAGRRPPRQDVVGDVVVQIDQTGIDAAPGLEPGGGLEAGRRGLGATLDGGDPLVGADVKSPVIDHRPGRVEGDQLAVEDERRDRHSASSTPGGHRSATQWATGCAAIPDAERATVEVRVPSA